MRSTAPRLIGLAACAALGIGALSACGSTNTPSSGAKPDVVASTNVWGDVAEHVAGRYATVHSIISNPAQDPHSFEPSTRTALTIKKADVLIENGGGYDDFMSKLRTSTGTKAAIVDAVSISGKKPVNGELNEHVWYDFATVQKVADSVATALAKADSKHASTYRANAATFDASVQKLIDQVATDKASVRGRGIAITEPVPLYLTSALGLVNRTPAKFSEAIEEGDDMSPTVLADTLALFTHKRVSALVYNEQTTGTLTTRVLDAAKSASIPVVPVTETMPRGDNYVSWMQSNLDHLVKALSTSKGK